MSARYVVGQRRPRRSKEDARMGRDTSSDRYRAHRRVRVLLWGETWDLGQHMLQHTDQAAYEVRNIARAEAAKRGVELAIRRVDRDGSDWAVIAYDEQARVEYDRRADR